MEIRKIVVIRESVLAEAGKPVAPPVNRVAGIAVISNPFAGRFVEDLSPLFDLGAELGTRLMTEVMAALNGAAAAYGKAAIVGVGGDIEHAAALLHPKLGKPMRAAVGGGAAIIPSTAKVAGPGASIDIPLGNKDNVWAFDEIDTMTVMVADAPRPGEIVVAVAVSSGGRPQPRVGKGRAVV